MEEERIRHPAFPQPDDPEVKVWRYLDFEKFEWFVTNSRLFMPSADRLGDPLEGTRPEGDLKWWGQLAENTESEEKRKNIQHNCQLISHFANTFRVNYYVSCWHVNAKENQKMWSCYTKNSESVVIQTTYCKLQKLLPDYVELGMVRYIDYENDRVPTMNMFEYITHKSKLYRFENEVRAVFLPPVVDELGGAHFKENHFESEGKLSFFVYAPAIDISRLVHKVIIHPKVSLDFENTITEMCKKSNLLNQSIQFSNDCIRQQERSNKVFDWIWESRRYFCKIPQKYRQLNQTN